MSSWNGRLNDKGSSKDIFQDWNQKKRILQSYQTGFQYKAATIEDHHNVSEIFLSLNLMNSFLKFGFIFRLTRWSIWESLKSSKKKIRVWNKMYLWKISKRCQLNMCVSWNEPDNLLYHKSLSSIHLANIWVIRHSLLSQVDLLKISTEPPLSLTKIQK